MTPSLRDESDGVVYAPAKLTWNRTNADSTSWVAEIDVDCFNETDGYVVSIWVENNELQTGVHTEGLIEATPKQAREMAQQLIQCAEAIETANV